MTSIAILLHRIGWTGTEFARRSGEDYAGRVRWWVRGTNSKGNPCHPPAEVVAWLEQVATAVEGVGLMQNNMPQ